MYRSTLLGVALLLAGPAALAQSPAPTVAPAAATPKPLAANPVPAAKPPGTYAKPIAAAPVSIAVGELNGDCTTRAPNLIRDSRSLGGCAPCPRGRVPNLARQACVIPIPRRY